MTTSQSALNVKRATFFISAYKWLSQVMLFFWAIYYTSINLTGIEQGIIFSIFPLISILGVIPFGILSDRVRSRHLMFMGYVLCAIQFWGLTKTQDFIPIVLLMIFGGLSRTIIKLSADSFFYKTSDSQKSHEVGIYVGTFLFAAGIGAIMGGYLLTIIDFISVFKGLAILSLIIATMSFFLPKTETFHFPMHHYKNDLKSPKIMIFSATLMMWFIHMGSEVTSYGLFLRENLGLNYEQMGLYIGLAIVLMLLWTKLCSWQIHKGTPILNILYIGLGLAGIGHIVMVIPKLEWSWLGRVVHEMGDAYMFVFLYYGIRKLFPKERSGGNAGFLDFVQMTAIFIGSLLFAPLGKMFGNEYPLIIGGICSLIALPLAYRFSHLIKH